MSFGKSAFNEFYNPPTEEEIKHKQTKLKQEKHRRWIAKKAQVKLDRTIRTNDVCHNNKSNDKIKNEQLNVTHTDVLKPAEDDIKNEIHAEVLKQADDNIKFETEYNIKFETEHKIFCNRLDIPWPEQPPLFHNREESVENFFTSSFTHIDHIYNTSPYTFSELVSECPKISLSEKLNNKVLEDTTCELYNNLFSKPNNQTMDNKNTRIDIVPAAMRYIENEHTAALENENEDEPNTPPMETKEKKNNEKELFDLSDTNTSSTKPLPIPPNFIHTEPQYWDNKDYPKTKGFIPKEITRPLEPTKNIYMINNKTDILIVNNIQTYTKYDEIKVAYEQIINVVIVGAVNSGKSTLQNILAGGEDYCDVSRDENKRITIVLKENDQQGLTPQQINNYIKEYIPVNDKIITLAFNIPRTPHFGQKCKKEYTYAFYDLPGFGGSDDKLVTKHMDNTLEIADILILNINCLESVTTGHQKTLIDYVVNKVVERHNHIKVIITVNKTDLRTNTDKKNKDKYIDDIKQQFKGKVKQYEIVEICAKMIFDYTCLLSHEEIDVESTVVENVALSELSADWMEIEKSQLRSKIIAKIDEKKGKPSSYEIRYGYSKLKEVLDELVEETVDMYSNRLELHVQNKQYDKTNDLEKILEHYKHISEQKSLDKPVHSEYILDLIEKNLENTEFQEEKIKQLNIILIKYTTIISLYTNKEKLVEVFEKFYYDVLRKLYDNETDSLAIWYNLINKCNAFIDNAHVIKLLTKIYDINMVEHIFKSIKEVEDTDKLQVNNMTKYVPTLVKIVKDHKTIDCKQLVVNYINFVFILTSALHSNSYAINDNQNISVEALTLIVDRIIEDIPNIRKKYKLLYNLKYLHNSEITDEDVLTFMFSNNNNDEYTLLPGMDFLVNYINGQPENDIYNEPGDGTTLCDSEEIE